MASRRLSSAVAGNESRPQRPRTIAELTVDEFKGLFRTLLREEMEHHGHTHNMYAAQRQSTNQGGETSYHLHFLNGLPCELYTVNKVKDKDNQPVKIAITDSISKQTITSGPLASIKVELVVLDGDFDQDNWTMEEFQSRRVHPREGKGSLLKGKLVIQLSNGVGTLSDATFTDNSSWIRSRTFRLGAKVFDDRINEGRIKEARTEPFTVKEHRVESYQKHHLPALSDDVWRLEKIMRDGKFHSRLTSRGILCVQDFLSFLVLDQMELRNVLGRGMTTKIWESTLDHVRKIVSGNELFSFYSTGQGVELVCDSNFKLVGAKFGGYYSPLNVLNQYQQQVVTHLKKLALKNATDIVTLNAAVQVNQQPVDGLPHSLDMMDAIQKQGSSLLLSEDLVSLAACNDSQVGFRNQPSAPCINPLMDIRLRDGILTGNGMHSFQPHNPLHTDCFTVLGSEQSSISPRARASLSIKWLKLRVVVKFKMTMKKNWASKKAAIREQTGKAIVASAGGEVTLLRTRYLIGLKPAVENILVRMKEAHVRPKIHSNQGCSLWENELADNIPGSSLPGIQISELPHQDYPTNTPPYMHDPLQNWDYVNESGPRELLGRTMSEEDTAMFWKILSESTP